MTHCHTEKIDYESFLLINNKKTNIYVKAYDGFGSLFFM